MTHYPRPAFARFVVCGLVAALLTPIFTPSGRALAAGGAPGGLERAVVRLDGTYGWGSETEVSNGGDIVAFISGDSAIVEGDQNGDSDVFVRDMTTGVTERVTLTPSGGESDGRIGNDYMDDRALDISGDGRHVAFTSLATNLAPELHDQDRLDLFLRDRETDTTTLISADNTSQPGYVSAFDLSGDGRFIAYLGGHTASPDGTQSGSRGLYLYDVRMGTTRPLQDRAWGGVRMSGDGQFVAFHTSASLLPGDTDGGRGDIYVQNVVSGDVRLAPEAPGDPETSGGIGGVRIGGVSEDGTTVLVTYGDADFGNLTYVADLTTSQSERVPDTTARAAALSADGRWVLTMRGVRDRVLGMHSQWQPLVRSGTADAAPVIYRPEDVSFSPDGTSVAVVDNQDVLVGPFEAVTSADLPFDTDREGDGATVSQPVEVAVTTPSLARTRVYTSPITYPVVDAAYAYAHPQVAVTTVAGTPANPMSIRFTIDPSLAPSHDVNTLPTVHRNGVEVPPCPGPGADPDPCVANAGSTAVGDGVITVRTTAGGFFNFAYPLDPNDPRGHNTWISLDSAGNASRTVRLGAASVTDDGRFVAFGAADGDSMEVQTDDVILRDVAAGSSQIASLLPDGQRARMARAPVLTGDGRFLLFTSSADPLAPPWTRNDGTFVRDLVTGTTREVSLSHDDTRIDGPADYTVSRGEAVSTNGRFVTFRSNGWSIAPGDENDVESDRYGNNPLFDIYLRDVQEGTTTIVSVPANAKDATFQTTFRDMSRSGRYVLWTVEDRPGGAIFDRTTRSNRRLANDCLPVQISEDARYVVCVPGEWVDNPDYGGEFEEPQRWRPSSSVVIDDLVTGTRTPLALPDGARLQAEAITATPSLSHVLVTVWRSAAWDAPPATYLLSKAGGEPQLVGRDFAGRETEAAGMALSADARFVALRAQDPGVWSEPSFDDNGRERAEPVHHLWLRDRAPRVAAEADGTASTGTKAPTALDVVTATVTSPDTGTVSLDEQALTTTARGFEVVGQQVQIEAPQATAADPLRFVFTIDASAVDGSATSSVEVFRDGVAVTDCLDDSGQATPDPCVSARQKLSTGDVRVWVLSSHASRWNLAVPDTKAPTPAMTTGLLSTVTARTFPVMWGGLDRESGVSRVTVQKAPITSTGGVGTFTPWASGSSATAQNFAGTPGQTYCFRARNEDRAGNLSAGWTAPSCRVVPWNDTVMTATSGWRRTAIADGYMGTAVATSAKGAALTKTVRARRVSLVATRCNGCGSVRVLWNGVSIKTISLASPTQLPHRRQVIPIANWTSIRNGILRLQVTTSGRPVIIEGLATTVR